MVFALDVCLLVGEVLGQRLVAIAHAVALYVGLGGEVDAVFVAELVPARVIGVVAGTHGVDVVLLHDLDVLYHALHRDNVSAVGVHLVAVGAFDKYRLAVDKELGVLDFHLAEARLLRYHLYLLAAVGERDEHGVEIGRLGGPLERIVHRHLGGVLAIAAHLAARRFHLASACVAQGYGHVAALRIAGAHHYGELAVAIVVRQVGGDKDIVDVLLRPCVEVHLAGYSREAPEVLVLEIGAVAPSHHLHGYEILFARHEVFGDIEFGGRLAVLAVAYEFAVHPHFEIGRGATDMEVDVIALP